MGDYFCADPPGDAFCRRIDFTTGEGVQVIEVAVVGFSNDLIHQPLKLVKIHHKFNAVECFGCHGHTDFPIVPVEWL